MLTRVHNTGNPRMVELIDTIMSIPSCLQDQQSKVQVKHILYIHCFYIDINIFLFPDTLCLGYKDHAVNTEKYVYYHKVQRISEV